MLLQVLSLEDAKQLLQDRFPAVKPVREEVALFDALHRVLFQDILAPEDVPAFSRSTVDGYAFIAGDAFGCSESSPALLEEAFSVPMGTVCSTPLLAGQCAAVPTGGALPPNADTVAMLEYTERIGKTTVALQKSCAPGENVVRRGDDVLAGSLLLSAGTTLFPPEIGALAALGVTAVPVNRRLLVGILSTGDEIVPSDTAPLPGQMRDVNAPMLAAAIAQVGAVPVVYGICRDDRTALKRAIERAVSECDVVLLSGGSSAGEKDAAEAILSALGSILFHGLAIKPGKPTVCGAIQQKPVVCLPGHPVAACLVCYRLVLPLLCRLQGSILQEKTATATLLTAIPSNHGREEFVPVRLTDAGAVPVFGKSGLITKLAATSGYLRIPRDAEGLAAGTQVTVFLWEGLCANRT